MMKPHESPRINKKSISADFCNSWPVSNRGISEPSEDSHQPVHPCNLIRVFNGHSMDSQWSNVFSGIN